ncbi:hypothetical protein [Nonomuraea sp. NPDC052265]|uniref:hypothetical protein n=1 Tax=Nonomuraea sp. NPDC052265 TaxID=3364374 RepID=UPI0037C61C2C
MARPSRDRPDHLAPPWWQAIPALARARGLRCRGGGISDRADRRCTTHHAVQDELARLYPRATVARDVLYVEDDRIVTSAGVAGGIDVALHLVTTRYGPYA